MRHFRDLYLIGISFVAGVLFIIQCGGAAKSLAEAVTDALGINYSNSDSGLSATTIQAAVDELAAAFPFIYDSSGNKVGVYLSDPGGGWWEMWDMSQRAVFPVEPATGIVIVNNPADTGLFFGSTDCTGTVYLKANAETASSWHPVSVDGILYKIKFGGTVKTESDIKSTKDGTGTCRSGFFDVTSLKRSITVDEAGDEAVVVLVEAETVSEPSYTGPLFIQ